MGSYQRRKDFYPSLNIRVNYIMGMFNKENTSYSGNMFLLTLGVSMDLVNW
jgi:outer membrane protein TolC